MISESELSAIESRLLRAESVLEKVVSDVVATGAYDIFDGGDGDGGSDPDVAYLRVREEPVVPSDPDDRSIENVEDSSGQVGGTFGIKGWSGDGKKDSSELQLDNKATSVEFLARNGNETVYRKLKIPEGSPASKVIAVKDVDTGMPQTGEIARLVVSYTDERDDKEIPISIEGGVSETITVVTGVTYDTSTHKLTKTVVDLTFENGMLKFKSEESEEDIATAVPHTDELLGEG